MIELVITGGQTGADLGAWKAAKDCGIKTGGWMPPGFLTEAGRHPEYAEEFGAEELSPDRWGKLPPSLQYSERRLRNIRMSDSAWLFGDIGSRGSLGLIRDCQKVGKPWVDAPAVLVVPSSAARWLQSMPDVKVLMIAGNRESGSPGIEYRVYRFLLATFRLLKEGGGD